jgi:hypothetical protein
MRDRRQSMINRDDTFNIDDTQSSAPTLRDADAALYGALSNVDKKRKSIERTRFGAFTITSRGLEMGEGAQQKDWEDAGAFIFQVDTALQWLIGDWLVYGADLQWGELEEQVKRFERDYQTLRDYMSVSRNVPLSLRNYNLSYNHYRAVASLEDEWKAYALNVAELKKLSVVNFRKWIKQGMPENWDPDEQPALPEPYKPRFNPTKRLDNAIYISEQDLTRIPPGEIRAAVDDFDAVIQIATERRDHLLAALQQRQKK